MPATDRRREPPPIPATRQVALVRVGQVADNLCRGVAFGPGGDAQTPQRSSGPAVSAVAPGRARSHLAVGRPESQVLPRHGELDHAPGITGLVQVALTAVEPARARWQR